MRQVTLAATLCALSLAGSVSAHAASAVAADAAAKAADAVAASNYPDKPIRVIVPGAAGGAADTLARALANNLSTAFGQPVVVENRVGAAGIVGTVAIAKAPADGYTLGFTFSGAMSINPSLYKSLPYDVDKDFEPVGVTAVSPLVIAVSPKLGVNTLGELVERAKREPGKLTFGSTGVGSTQQLSMELLRSQAGINMLHVPYKGSAAALTDLISGQISVHADNALSVIPFAQSGQLKALAVGTTKRIASLPDVPTVAESGYPDYQAAGWYGMVAPAGTPKAVITKLSLAMTQYLKQPETVKWLEQQGMVPQLTTPAEFRTFMGKERAKWARVIKDADVPVQDLR